MKEALLYEKLKEKRVSCHLCSHRCTISLDRTGICGVRKNKAGRLFSLVYGKAIAANVDPIEKKPLFHFLPSSLSFSIAAAGCNFSCRFCQNADISQISKSKDERILERVSFSLPPEEVVSKALETNCRSVAYTYTEPTVFFEYACDTARLAKKKGLKNIFVTNGYQTPEAIKLMAGLIDAANVDLKSFSDSYYRRICGARLQPVLNSIKLMHQANIWLEITTLIVPTLNDSDAELEKIAKFIAKISRNTPWHLSRFYGAYKMSAHPPTPIETLYRAAEIGKKAGLNYVYVGNVPGNKYENTHCPKCQATVIERVGYNIRNNLKGKSCLKCGKVLSFTVVSN